MPKGHGVGWQLFLLLDEQAAEADATVGDVLDVAALVLGQYILRMRDELHAAGLTDIEQRAHDAACWEMLKERARLLIPFLQKLESVDGGTVQ